MGSPELTLFLLTGAILTTTIAIILAAWNHPKRLFLFPLIFVTLVIIFIFRDNLVSSIQDLDSLGPTLTFLIAGVLILQFLVSAGFILGGLLTWKISKDQQKISLSKSQVRYGIIVILVGVVLFVLADVVINAVEPVDNLHIPKLQQY